MLSAGDASPVDGEGAVAREVERRRGAEGPPSGSRMLDALRTAAASYAVDFEGGSASVAGFPWFDVWTRDTFTSFTGLYLATGRFAAARELLATFAPLVRDGMLPANLPDAVTKPRWNAADASLWFVVSVDRYLRYTNDVSALGEFAMEAVRSILDGYDAGKPPHIRVDADGLVYASAPDQALTWMDADDEGHVMTPRRGKPRYVGDRSERDPAYHQGTVWPFLLGPFLHAWARLHGGTGEARREALGMLGALEDHIDGAACFGHLSEIFDADAPHAPRGCFAQAWSAGELLGALHDLIDGSPPCDGTDRARAESV